MRIAVFTDENATLCDFFEAQRLMVWEEGPSGWTVSADNGFKKVIPSTPAQTRKDANAVLQLAGDCEVIAGGSITGLPYTVFDQAGKHIFQIGEVNDDVLSGIMYDVTDALLNTGAPHECNNSCDVPCSQNAAAKVLAPDEISPGVYSFDLIAMQLANPAVSSKNALQDFMETTPFTELHIRCKHVPPWIERDYTVRVAGEESGAVNAVVTK